MKIPSSFAPALCLLVIGCEPQGGNPPPGPVSAPPPASSPTTPAASAASPPPAAPQAPQPAAESRPKSLKDALRTPERIKALNDSLRHARKALAAGDKAKALDFLEDVVSIDQEHREGARLKAEILRSLGQYDTALEALAAPLKNTPGEPVLIEEKTRILLAKGDVQGAIATLEGLLVEDAPLLGARFLRAVAAAASKDSEGTLRSLEDAVARGFLSRSMVENEKQFDLVRSDPRFKAILDKLQAIEQDSARAVTVLRALEEPRRPPAAPPANFSEQLAELTAAARAGRGEEAPFALADVDGKPLRLSDFQGKVVVVFCWGTWSEDSRNMFPEINRLRDEYAGKGVEVVGLSYEIAAVPGNESEMAHDVKAYQKDFKLDAPTGIINKKIAVDLFITSFPNVLIYGADGKVYTRAPGFKPYHVLKSMVDVMLENKPGAAATPPKQG